MDKKRCDICGKKVKEYVEDYEGEVTCFECLNEMEMMTYD